MHMYFDKNLKRNVEIESFIHILIINIITCDSKVYVHFNFIIIVRHIDMRILRRNFKIYNYNMWNNTRVENSINIIGHNHTDKF